MVKQYFILLTFLFAFLLQGCLVVTKRVFTYTIKKDRKVELIIKYIDIRSASTTNGLEPDTGFVERDDEQGMPEEVKDYQTLIQEFYTSDYFADCYKSGKVVSRKLYEDKGVLTGEVKVIFESVAKAGFIIDKGKYVLRSDSLCGFMPYVDSISLPEEKQFIADTVSQHFKMKWPKKSKSFSIGVVPYFPFKESVSLLEQWKKDK